MSKWIAIFYTILLIVVTLTVYFIAPFRGPRIFVDIMLLGLVGERIRELVKKRDQR